MSFDGVLTVGQEQALWVRNNEWDCGLRAATNGSNKPELEGYKKKRKEESQTEDNMTAAAIFVFDAAHHVVVCRSCESCIVPGQASIERHLRREPHYLVGGLLKSTVAYLLNLDLKPLAELRAHKPEDGGVPVKHLKTHKGYRCLLCSNNAENDGNDRDNNRNKDKSSLEQSVGRPFRTTHLPLMGRHVSGQHGRKPSQHVGSKPLWQECRLQSYFCAKGRIDYFVVVQGQEAGRVSKDSSGPSKSNIRVVDGNGHTGAEEEEEKKLFARLEDDVNNAKREVKEGGIVVKEFDSKTSRVPWLERTGFISHLAGLLDVEIKSSYQLPNGNGDGEGQLKRICEAAELVLRDAYKLCSDMSPDRKMTQQRANILNQFYAGASGRADGFRYYKNVSTLQKYFATFKRLLAYYFRVVHSADEHFTRTQAEQVLPQEVIQHTKQQRQAADEVIVALDGGNEDALKHSIRRLYLGMICHCISSNPYHSVVLSFCAMLSRKGDGLWEEPGNFNSHLSALTWTAQLVIFDYACFHEQEDERQIPELLTTICQKFFQQLAETPFGHILQWRLYLFKVAKVAITKHAARWSLDGQMVTYRALELQMSDVLKLVQSEFRQAHALLYDELLFDAHDLVPMQSWRLKDDLDIDGFGRSWLDEPANAVFLEKANVALLRRIRASPALRAMFLVEAEDKRDGSISLSSKAMAIYEAHAQELLRHLLILCHITSGQPLREPELLSITWRNTARLRNVYIWQRLVMIHTQYHKGQQQSGMYKNNIRFLPRAVGDLLLDYTAYVLPLRQLFLHQQTTAQALLSPYLWSTLDGAVWPDGTLSRCLIKACTRAQVPRLHTSNWRQISVSICKEKFSSKERASFDLECAMGAGMVVEEDEELELVAMAEQSNHSYNTFNYAYTGTSVLTTNSLLHRGYRASESWRTFFRFDQALGGKQRRSESSTTLQMLVAAKRSQVRKRVVYSETDLTAVARRLFMTPNMMLRAPGQRDGLLAMVGPQAAEQVVLVLGTGSGKSLVFMVGASVAEAQTTILILPMVALRQEMLRRCLKVGMRPLIWSGDCRDTARLVIVSAEAACTPSFLEYAQGLIGRQILDRIIVDECHLTVTTSDYRPRMLELGWYIRQLRTQSVWLTATLPPSMEDEFINQNKLVRPTVIRESTNRPNIKYLVSYETGPGSLVEKAAGLIQSFWPRLEIFDHSRDKIIIYCRMREEVGELAALLGCPSYTSKSGDEEEKAAIISTWLADRGQPAIVATSALGVGFDYPFIRWVVHVDAPEKLTDFSQESGRAGRDGAKASSITLLHSGWKPRLDVHLAPDQEAMQLYLAQKYCSRGVLSQFLDAERHWRWCMEGEECCQVCDKPHKDQRPVGVPFGLASEAEVQYTGPAEVLRQDHVRNQVIDRYEKDLEIMVGSCLYCRVSGRKFDHEAGRCPRRFHWINAKTQAYDSRKRENKEWIGRYLACWKCYQPQEICRVADTEHDESECRFPDMVMPLCYGVYFRPGRDAWLLKHFQRKFGNQLEYMLWLGEKASLKGNECIQANCVAAIAMGELG